MRILFIGCVQSSAFLLKNMILSGIVPVGVVTKKHSNYNSDHVDLEPICQRFGIPCIQTVNINDDTVVDFIESCRPDVIYCFGWSQIVCQRILDIPALGSVGFHPAKLPYNRGRHPIIWALALGLEKTASTFFLMDSQADTGPIISQMEVPILYEDNAATLYEKILSVAITQVLVFTKELEDRSVTKILQPPGVGNHWRKRGMQDGQIDWRMSSRAIYNLIRALTKPYPGAHFVKDEKLIKIWRAAEIEITNIENIEPGKVIDVLSPTEFQVKAYDKVIHVLDCEPVDLKVGEYL